jgi:hypothetical protein
MADRMMVFVDYQNVYKGARDAFFPNATTGMEGQFHPLALAKILCQIRQEHHDTELTKVLVYRGMPDARKDQKGNSASSRQKARWEKAGIVVKTRPLRYPLEWPNEKPQESTTLGCWFLVTLTFAPLWRKFIGSISGPKLPPGSRVLDLRPAYLCQMGGADWSGATGSISVFSSVAAIRPTTTNRPRVKLPQHR